MYAIEKQNKDTRSSVQFTIFWERKLKRTGKRKCLPENVLIELKCLFAMWVTHEYTRSVQYIPCILQFYRTLVFNDVWIKLTLLQSFYKLHLSLNWHLVNVFFLYICRCSTRRNTAKWHRMDWRDKCSLSRFSVSNIPGSFLLHLFFQKSDWTIWQFCCRGLRHFF